MRKILVLSAILLLATQAVIADSPPRTITAQGRLSAGNNVTAQCVVQSNGSVRGTGRLYGTNPSNGYTYSYPFVINSIATASGRVILGGNFAVTNGARVTLTASVPQGPMVFTYGLSGGGTYSYTGQGTVTVR